jgi:hypothetical protein
MFTPLGLSAKRAGRYLVSYGIAFILWIIAGKLSGLQVPEYLTPVIAAIISAIGKYIRETLKMRVPF